MTDEILRTAPVDHESETVSSILRFSSPGARAVFLVFQATHLLLVIATLATVRSPGPSIEAFGFFAVAGVILVLPASDPLPIARTIMVIAAIAVVTELVDWNLPATGWPGYASWHFGGCTVYLVFLALRGRLAAAWAGLAVMVGITTVWALDVGRPLGDVAAFLGTQAGALLVGTLFTLLIRGTSRRTAALRRSRAELLATEPADDVALREHASQARCLESVARTELETIARGGPFTPEQRRHWLGLADTLRDSLRAPALLVPSVLDAAIAARRRGVDVTLLDDSAEDPHRTEDVAIVIEAIVTELEATAGGRVTARVLPNGREYLATIFVEHGETVRFVQVEYGS